MKQETPRTVIVHTLKAWPEHFEAILQGKKTADVRRADRDFRVGDVLDLREWVPSEVQGCLTADTSEQGSYTGRQLQVRVTHITRSEGATVDALRAGFVVLSIRRPREGQRIARLRREVRRLLARDELVRLRLDAVLEAGRTMSAELEDLVGNCSGHNPHSCGVHVEDCLDCAEWRHAIDRWAKACGRFHLAPRRYPAEDDMAELCRKVEAAEQARDQAIGAKLELERQAEATS